MMNIVTRIYGNSAEVVQDHALSRLHTVDKERFKKYKDITETIKLLEKDMKILENAKPSSMFSETRIKGLLLVNKKFLDEYRQSLSSYGPEYALYDKKIK